MSNASDRFNLSRFTTAQNPVYEQVEKELREGRKRTHWMWFVFPQIIGLGQSEQTRWFAISCLDEARAYLEHPILGQRLRNCTRLVLEIQGKSVGEIFGSPDDLKFRSCMTLFARATSVNSDFNKALKRYFDGIEDPLTLERI
ncbi:MAG: DUF1810 domain-containing protein [Terriglobales bacterium]